MILGECGVFARMFASGIVAGGVSAFWDLLGKAGKAARVVADVLTAITMGFLYFISLYHAAYGVFRLYSLAAYLLGMYVLYAVLRRFAPTFRRVGRKLVTLMIRAYDAAVARWEAHLAPIREKCAAKRALRMEKRAERRAAAAEKKAARKACFPHRNSRGRRNVRIVVDR